MCEPISIATGAMSAIGAVGQHQSASAAADAQNEASIRNYEHQLQVRENKHMQKLSAWANDRRCSLERCKKTSLLLTSPMLLHRLY